VDTRTCGPWPTEQEAEDWLAAFLDGTGLFHVLRQVRGVPLQRHHFQRTQGVRADLLLLPSVKFTEAGWKDGAIVVEVKKPGAKIGPGISQLLDYMRTAWCIDGGIAIVPSFGFLFAARKQIGPFASLMAHQHIGTASLEDDDRLDLCCGHSGVLRLSGDGDVIVKPTEFGRKMGAR
jgi:hypothetical protein